MGRAYGSPCEEYYDDGKSILGCSTRCIHTPFQQHVSLLNASIPNLTMQPDRRPGAMK